MKQRGVFEKIPGSGIHWIRYADATGRIRREKIGPKSAAIKLHHKRKTEVLQGKKLPEQLRNPVVRFSEIADDASEYCKANNQGYQFDAVSGGLNRNLGTIVSQSLLKIFAGGSMNSGGKTVHTIGTSPHCPSSFAWQLKTIRPLQTLHAC